MNSMKLYIFACLCSLILWGVSCNEESAGIPTGSLFLGIEEDATLLTKAESAVTNESLRVDIIAAEGDTIKSYSCLLYTSPSPRDRSSGRNVYDFSKIKPVGRGRMGKTVLFRFERNNHSVR